MNSLKKWILIAVTSLCTSAFANTYTSDLSDQWWSEKEPGWGVSVNHQREVLFMTFFLYGKDGKVAWYTGQASHTGETPQGALIFTGGMYEYSGGSYFAGAYNAANVTGRSAGTMTFTAFLDSANLTYSIDGVTVTKVVSRQTFRNNDLTGAYMGGIKQNAVGCVAPYVSGEVNRNTEINVTNTANSFAMTVRQPDNSVCTFSGSYVQTGRLGRSEGTYTCPGGVKGKYDAFELEANTQGFSGRFFASDNFCDSLIGRFGVMKK